MRLAVIPARGGSKRIPRKNIRPFAGVPMIAHAISTALGCGLFGRVVVSTDDDEIAAIAREAGAEVPFRRPAELADDYAPTVPVIAHAVREAGADALLACCIYPATPLLRADDLREALALLESSGADYAFPVVAFEAPIQRALRRATDGSTQPFQPEYAAMRSQDLEPAYHDAGQFYWGRRDAWLAERNIHRHGVTTVLPGWRVVDIDTPDDWRRAEAMHRALVETGA